MLTTLKKHPRQALALLFLLITAAAITGGFVYYEILISIKTPQGLVAGHAANVSFIAALLVCFTGAVMLLLWWRSEARRYRKPYEIEQQYHELSSLYALLMKNANDMILLADEEKRIIEANDRACSTYGYSRDELIGRYIKDLRAPEAQKDIETQFAQAAKQNGICFETLGRKKDGTVFPIATSIRVLTSNGRTYYIGIVRDISERWRAKQELLRLRREWEEIFQAVGNPAFILEPDNGVVSVNRAMQKALGMTEEQIVGRKCYELLHCSDHPPEQCPLSKMIASNQTEVSEMEVEKLGGVFQVTCTPMFDESGRLVKAIHIAADITALKQALRQAQKNETRFSLLIAAAPDAIVVTDDCGTIKNWNSKAEEIFGIAASEALGKSCEIYMPDEVRQQYRQGLSRFLATRVSQFSGKIYQSTALRKDGTKFPVEVSTSFWKENGRTYFVSFVRDVTERVQTEQQIQKQLEELRQWQRVTVGREERMMELKQEVNSLLEQMGKPLRYPRQTLTRKTGGERSGKSGDRSAEY